MDDGRVRAILLTLILFVAPLAGCLSWREAEENQQEPKVWTTRPCKARIQHSEQQRETIGGQLRMDFHGIGYLGSHGKYISVE